MMIEEGSEVSSVTITKITLPLHEKILLNPKLIQEKMFHYFLLAHEKKNEQIKVCRVSLFLRQPGTT